MTSFINASNVIFTNNSSDPDIYLKPANGKNLILQGSVEGAENGVFETLLVKESTELRSTTHIKANQVNALTTTITELDIEQAGFGRSVAAHQSSRGLLVAVSSNLFPIGDVFGDPVYGVFDVFGPDGIEVPENMPLPFSTCGARNYGESVAIYENDAIITSVDGTGSDHTAVYKYNSGIDQWEFIQFWETGPEWVCDLRQDTACSDTFKMTRSGATWTTTNIGLGSLTVDCACCVIDGNRVFFHALSDNTIRVEGSSTVFHPITATSLHVSDQLFIAGTYIARLACLNGNQLLIYNVSTNGGLTLFQTIVLPESFDTVRISSSASLIALVKAGKACFVSLSEGVYVFQTNPVSTITFGYTISTSKRAVALTENKLIISSTNTSMAYQYNLNFASLTVETKIPKLTVNSSGIETSGPYTDISSDQVGIYTSESDRNIMRYLVVGGGGPGGYSAIPWQAGGGGAGQLIQGSTQIKAKNYVFQVSVGQGAVAQDIPNNRGQKSTLKMFSPSTDLDIEALGGGQGSGLTQNACFGGGGCFTGVPERKLGAEGPNGFKGGDAPLITEVPAGGAGSAGNGEDGTPQSLVPIFGGLGGAGTTSDITGTNVVYAAGGRGSNRETLGVLSTAGENGADNTGNGGTGGFPEGSGGSGVVIVRFPTVYFQGYTGDCTLSVSGTDTILKFLSGEGTFTLDSPDGVNLLDRTNVFGPTRLQDTLTVWKKTELLDTTASTTTATGALVVSGGAGVGGSLNVGGTINAPNCTISTLLNYSGRATGTVLGNGTQSIANATGVTLTAAYFNGTASLNGPITYSNGAFMVGRTGWYMLSCNVIFSNNGSGNERTADIKINATTIAYTVNSGFNAGVRASVAVSTPAFITSGQVISVIVFQDSGSSLNMSNFTGGYLRVVEL